MTAGAGPVGGAPVQPAPGARRDEVIAIVDELRSTEPARSYAGTLAVILESSSESLAALAAYHAAELGLTALRPGIEALRDRPSAFLPEIAARALEVLDQGQAERAANA